MRCSLGTLVTRHLIEDGHRVRCSFGILIIIVA